MANQFSRQVQREDLLRANANEVSTTISVFGCYGHNKLKTPTVCLVEPTAHQAFLLSNIGGLLFRKSVNDLLYHVQQHCPVLLGQTVQKVGDLPRLIQLPI